MSSSRNVLTGHIEWIEGVIVPTRFAAHTVVRFGASGFVRVTRWQGMR
jgi:hypothetical protein